MLLNCGVEKDSWEYLGDLSSFLNILWKDRCWRWNSNTLTTWCKELTLGKDPDAGKHLNSKLIGPCQGSWPKWKLWGQGFIICWLLSECCNIIIPVWCYYGRCSGVIRLPYYNLSLTAWWYACSSPSSPHIVGLCWCQVHSVVWCAVCHSVAVAACQDVTGHGDFCCVLALWSYKKWGWDVSETAFLTRGIPNWFQVQEIFSFQCPRHCLLTCSGPFPPRIPEEAPNMPHTFLLKCKSMRWRLPRRLKNYDVGFTSGVRQVLPEACHVRGSCQSAVEDAGWEQRRRELTLAWQEQEVAPHSPMAAVKSPVSALVHGAHGPPPTTAKRHPPSRWTFPKIPMSSPHFVKKSIKPCCRLSVAKSRLALLWLHGW